MPPSLELLALSAMNTWLDKVWPHSILYQQIWHLDLQSVLLTNLAIKHKTLTCQITYWLDAVIDFASSVLSLQGKFNIQVYPLVISRLYFLHFVPVDHFYFSTTAVYGDASSLTLDSLMPVFLSSKDRTRVQQGTALFLSDIFPQEYVTRWSNCFNSTCCL